MVEKNAVYVCASSEMVRVECPSSEWSLVRVSVSVRVRVRVSVRFSARVRERGPP